MGIQEISANLDKIHKWILTTAQQVNDNQMSLEQGIKNVADMTQQMPPESRAAAEGLLRRLTAKR